LISEDYLKYWRVVRYYIKKKYKLTTAELETLLFLKTEGRFSRDDFQKFNEVISWNKDRFEKLRREGWIVHCTSCRTSQRESSLQFIQN